MTHATVTLDLIEQLRAKGEEFCVATIVRTANLTSAKAGAKAVVTKDGEMHGFVGGGCVTGAVRAAALEALSTGAPQMVRIRPKDEVESEVDVDVDGAPLYKSSCPSGGTVEIFLEPMRTARKLIVFGTSPVADALIAIAKAVGFAVARAGADESDGDIEGGDAVVIATQGRLDREALRAALASPARYVAMVGSREKIAKLRRDLAEEGACPAARLDQLRGPAGLDIGAVGPEEIALSIVTEIVKFLRKPETASVPKSA